jgi:CRP-like cAMP-binding protein
MDRRLDMGGTPPAATIPNAFVNRLGQLVPLSAEEVTILQELQASPRTVQRHRDIITEGRNYGSIFIILEGNAIRYRILHDGRRQIVNIVLPGDIVGALGYFMESSLYSTKALTEVVVATIPFARLNA